MTETDPVRVGVVGLGNIAHHHATQLAELDAEIVGGMDIDADARRRFAEAYDADTFEDVDNLLATVEAAVVTTPNRFHEEYAVAALDAGVDVLLEKPLAHDVASAERIAAAARDASDAFCMVGFNNRFANPVQVLKHYQRAGRLGEVRHVEANYVRRRGIPGRGSWFTSKAVAGGGSLIDIGVHAVDLSLYFLDFPEVVEVSGVTRSQFGTREDYAFVEMWGPDEGPGGFDVDDSASAFVRCADGRTISLEVAWAANRPTDDEYYVRGTEAGARYDRAEQDLTLFEASGGGRNHLADTAVETQTANTHRAEQAAFLRAVRAGEPPTVNTVDQALTVQRVIDAVYRSADAGAAVRLDDGTGAESE
jgi:predicted dehydrogenase